jgi:nucleotide-binding universal stress UspA family protein
VNFRDAGRVACTTLSQPEKEEMMVPQIKKILYATDLSKNSAYAFFYAVDMAKKHNARIVISHTVEPVPHVNTEGGTDILKKINEQGQE